MLVAPGIHPDDLIPVPQEDGAPRKIKEDMTGNAGLHADLIQQTDCVIRVFPIQANKDRLRCPDLPLQAGKILETVVHTE